MKNGRLIILATLIAALLAFGWFFMRDKEHKPPPPASDYRLGASWTIRPETPPAPVWEGGWAYDILLFNADRRRDSQAYAEALRQLGPVYAPVLRPGQAGPDAASALDAYLQTDNRGRAFIIALNFPLTQEMVSAIGADPMIRARFGGLLLVDRLKTAFGPDLYPASVCSDRFGSGEVCEAPIQIRRNDSKWTIVTGDGQTNPVTDGFSEWLEQYAPKMAEPLGQLEEIGISEIRRPGQID